MEAPVTLGEAFDVRDLDYLRDSDGDGVGDVNEVMESTDPADPTSTPGASTIDLLSFYNQRYADLYDGDATTRIQHLVTLSERHIRKQRNRYTAATGWRREHHAERS